MSLLGIRWTPEPIRSATAAAITAGATDFVTVGTTTTNPANQFYLLNLTDALLIVSFDGVNDHLVMPAGTNFFDDVGSDKSNQSGALVLAAGTQIWVAYEGGANPTTGSFYASIFYAASQES